MRIGILGSGLMGSKLGTIFARAGHDVVFSYSTSERKLKRLAREAGGHARAGPPREAALDADAVCSQCTGRVSPTFSSKLATSPAK
jgi:8-hydroxy-5-deazaflavin:NADPH oxidoreductase